MLRTHLRNASTCRPVSDYFSSDDAKIHSAIEHHLSQAAYLRQLLNERACPLNRLPAELLARVLYFCMPLNWGINDAALRRFMALTNVCSRWREVALNTPALWAQAPCFQPELTSMVLERAKQAPLSIVCTRSWAEYSYGKPHMESLYEMLGLFQNLHRVQFLQMACERPVLFVDALKVALQQPAPLLEHLDLNGIMPISGSFPEVPFGGQAPRLRHLALRNWQLPPASLSIPWLRYLYLGSVKASLQSLMRLLSALPNLESLQVLDCMSSETGTPDLNTGSTHVELSSLRSLDITDNAASVVGLMQHLSANSVTRLQMVCKRSSGDEILDLLNSDVISSQLSRLKEHLTIARLTDSMSSHSFLATSASTFNYDEEREAASLLSIVVRDTGDPLLPGQFDTFSAVLSRMGTLCLRILRVATDCSLYPPSLTDKATWLRAFPFPHTIREVQLVGSLAAGLIDALGHVDGPSTAVPKRRGKAPAAGRAKDATRPAALRLFFGELHTLRVQDVDFRRKLRTITLRQLFRQRLKMRAVAGAPLGCLQVYDCKGFGEEDKEDIDSGEWAASVDWDEIFDSDDDSDDNEDDSLYDGPNDSEGDWCSDCGVFHSY
jgi:hypothetical protein